MIGTTLGSYKIVRELGKGGMGVVYFAEHPMIGKKAAIKLLRPEYSKDPEVVARFFNEAKAVTTINHPGLVDVYDFGMAPDGGAYIVMEFLEGESLSARIKRERIPNEAIVAITRQLCGALGAAHAHRITHRDLKPDNIFLCPDPDVPGGIRAKVLDFGIAKLAPDPAAGDSGPHTQTGMMMGTPLYMAPEQCRGAGAVDRRADIYALGVIMYEMVCGRVPFTADGMGEIIAKHQYEPPAAPRMFAPNVPVALETLILRMLEKKADDRPQTMDDVAAALDGKLKLEVAATAYEGAKPGAATTGPAREAAASREATPSRTTLSGAAGAKGPTESTVPPARNRRGLALGVVAGVLAIGGVVFFVVRPTGTSTQVNGALPAAPPPAPPPASPPPPAKITLKIDSVPGNADVYRAVDGVRVGKTPFARQVEPTEGQAVFLIKLAGYADQTVELDAAADGDRTVTLEPLGKPAAPIDAAVDAPPRPRPPRVTPPPGPEAVNPFDHSRPH